MATRRDFLKSAIVLGAFTSLAACHRRLIRPPSCEHFDHSHSSFVADAHCHIFNATDLQVSGFINETQLKISDTALVAKFAQLVQSIGWHLAPSAQEEINWLQALNSKDGARPTLAAGVSSLASRGGPPLDATIQDMGTNSDARYTEFWKDADTQDRATTRAFLERVMMRQGRFGVTSSGMSTAKFLTSLQSAEGLREVVLGEQSLVQSGISAVITFLKAFFRFRTENAWTMLQMYGCDSRPGIDMICPAMVDFDIWIGDVSVDQGRTESHIDKQLELMKQISLATRGRVQPLAPFNPLRAACDGGDVYLAKARKAVEEYGCIGFKLYPPMGFRATGNDEISTPLPKCPLENHGPVSRKMIDQVLTDFFVQCEEMDVPILAHTSQSNGPDDEAESMADPMYWARLLELQATRGSGKLRISLGHMGGDHDLDKPCNWRKEIACMMARYPGQVFADLSYYQHMLGSNSTRTSLAKQMQMLKEGTVWPHVMYGSDWDMLGIEPGASHYLTMFNQFLVEDLELSPEQMHAILGENAKVFFGLRPGDQSAERLKKFHGASVVLPFQRDKAVTG